MVKLVIQWKLVITKKKVAIVATTIVKFTKLVVGTKTQLVKSRKILVRYPYMIYSSVKH